jgi:lactoylglutathione lyase
MKRTCLYFSVVALFCFMSALQAQQPATKNGEETEYVGLAHINIQTKDLEKSLSFYQDVLHFTVAERSETVRPNGTSKTALIKLGSCILELTQPANPESVVEKAGGIIAHFAIEVRNLPKAVADLKSNGIQPERDVSTNDKLFGGIRVAFIRGPSGESIELFEFLNQSHNPNVAK